MLPNVRQVIEDAPLVSRDDAERFLTRYLPMATAANPKYRTGDGVLMAWITKSVAFKPGRPGQGLTIAMTEETLEFRNGAQTAKGSHDVEFSLADVQVSERRDAATLTEGGRASVGIYFNCNTGKCILSAYDGKPSQTDQSDISIQDDALRGKILKAFLMLKPAAT